MGEAFDETEARDPALFFSLYLHKQSVGKPDARAAILQQVDAFVDRYQLLSSSSDVPYSKASSIDLLSADQTPAEFRLLFRARAGYTQPPSGTSFEVLIYGWHDALILQVQIARFHDWHGGILDGWRQNTSLVREVFDPKCLGPAASSVFGLSVVYWVIADQPMQPAALELAVSEVLDTRDVGRAETDVGHLWACDQPLFEEVKIHQDRWVLVTPRQHEAEINKRYYWQSRKRPSDFTVLALARHKIFFELNEHQAMRSDLESPAKALDRDTFSFLENQRRLGSELDELLSDWSLDFQHNLVHAANRLAEYRNWAGRLKELRRTIAVNRRNYLLHSVCLLSERDRRKVERSLDREQAAMDFLDAYKTDGIFSTDLGTIGQHCDQLDTDLDYAESLISRHAATLRSATDQLRIVGERDIAEIAHHMGVDSAAVVASIGALIAIELAVKPHADEMKRQIDETKRVEDEMRRIGDEARRTGEATKGIAGTKNPGPGQPDMTITSTGAPPHRSGKSYAIGIHHYSIEFWFLIGWVILGLYGLTQALGARFRGKKPGEKSIVGAFALICAWLATVYLNHGFSFGKAREPQWAVECWVALILFTTILGVLLGFGAYELAWHHAKQIRERNARMRQVGP